MVYHQDTKTQRLVCTSCGRQPERRDGQALIPRLDPVACASTILFGAPQLAQLSAAGQQVIETPLRLDLTSLEDHDPVGALQCDTAMRHGDDGGTRSGCR